MQVKFFLIYLIIINIFSILITVTDKLAAQNKKSRIPEATLMIFSVLGGAFGMYITMQIVRHKTKKPKFMLGIPLILAAQLLLMLLFVKKYAIF